MDEKPKKARNFRNYKVWQDAVEYASKVYKITAEMPWFEKKGLCDQLQRAAVSISSNIAEGAAKPSDTEFAHFLDTALGSAFEVETQLLIAKNVGYITSVNASLNANHNANHNGSVTYEELLEGIDNIEHQLAALIKTLRQ
ncbi:MAG: diversity-generating retroelement protein bAvd family protein [Bacteroidetes bacterium]|nr:diversity-generating retroelement protein bAvd family protein [Bacteroidota bacterium]